MPHFKRRWDEVRGDEHADWGRSTWYFEVGDDGTPVRQLEKYDGGVALQYDGKHQDDEFGGLGEKSIELDAFAAFRIDRTEFENAWSSAVAWNRR